MTRGTPEGARDFLAPVRLQPGKFYRARAVAAALQAALHGRRNRPLLPDRNVLARRGSPRRPAVRVPPARPRDWRSPSGKTCSTCWSSASSRRSWRSDATPPERPFPRLDLRRGDGEVRHRQARPALRPRDPGRDRADARLGVRRVRATRRASASSSRRRRSRAPSSRRLEEVAKEWGAKGLAYIVVDESGEVARRSRSSCREDELAAFEAPSRARPCSSRAGEEAVGRARARRAAAAPRPRARAHRSRTRTAFHWVHRLPAVRAGRGHRRAGRSCTTRSRRPSPARRTWDESNPAGVQGQHYDLIWNGWELGSGSIRIHDVELQQRVFRTMGLGDEEAQRSSASCSRRSRWARRRTAASRWASTASSRCMAGEPDIRQVIAFPKVSSGSDPLTGAPTPMPDERPRGARHRRAPHETQARADPARSRSYLR